MQVYISTGRAARERLTDEYAATIISSMKPSLRRGEYDGAIQQAAVDIGLVLAGAVPQKPDDNDSGSNWLGGAIFLAFSGFLLTGCWYTPWYTPFFGVIGVVSSQGRPWAWIRPTVWQPRLRPPPAALAFCASLWYFRMHSIRRTEQKLVHIVLEAGQTQQDPS